MAVPRLRCLSLVRVHGLGLRVSGPEVPRPLLRDLAKARLFCGHYIIDEEVDKPGVTFLGRTFHQQLALTIKYDGDTWTLMYRSRSVELECCQNCAYSRPELVTIELKENTLVPFFALDAELAELAKEDSEACPLPALKFSVQMEDDGSKGELKFVGSSEVKGQVFESRLSVTMKQVKSWQGEAWGKAWAKSARLTGSFRDSAGRLTAGDLELSSTGGPVTAKRAFPPPADPQCENEWGEWGEGMDEDRDRSDDSMDNGSSEDDGGSDDWEEGVSEATAPG